MLAIATTSIVLAVAADGRQLRRRVVVEIPDVVVHGLEVPEPLAGPRVERDQAVAEQIGALAVAAVEVVLRAAGRDVDDAALRVDRLLAPVVGAADGLPRVRRGQVS